MARRGSRKVTPMLVADSFAIARTIREAVTVLRRWHPSLVSLMVIEQQVTTLGQELNALEVVVPPEAPAGMFQEET